MIDSLIKQQTVWSQGSSKYQKQKKYTRSENNNKGGIIDFSIINNGSVKCT
jgi:hypothetical protein